MLKSTFYQLILKVLFFCSISFAVEPNLAYIPSKVQVIDTVYTPAHYKHGPLKAFIFLPEVPNRIAAILSYGLNGNRERLLSWGDSLASIGYTAMVIEYHGQFGSDEVYPLPVTEHKFAIEFLRRKADDYNLDTDKIVGIGFSFGAVVWGQTIIWDNDDSFFNTDPTIDDKLNAAILFYGFYTINPSGPLVDWYFKEYPEYKFSKGNCIVNITNIQTPVFLLHGTKDENVHYTASVELHDSLKVLNKESKIWLLKDRPHGFDRTTQFELTKDGIASIDSVHSYLLDLFSNPNKIDRATKFENYKLYQNYPNPFNSTTTIQFYLPHESFVSIRVYNMLGEEVKILNNSRKDFGLHRIIWDGTNSKGNDVESGVFFYQIKTENFISTNKMVLLQ